MTTLQQPHRESPPMTIIASNALRVFILDSTDTYIEIEGIESVNTEFSASPTPSNAIHETPWRTLIEQSGQQAVRLNMRGTFCSHLTETILRQHALSMTHAQLRIDFGNSETLTGKFFISRLSRDGNGQSPAAFQCTDESAEPLIYS
jgi:predicted secreted protein